MRATTRILTMLVIFIFACGTLTSARGQTPDAEVGAEEPEGTGGIEPGSAPAAPDASQTGTEVALRAYYNQYVAAEGGGGGVVNANRSWVREWETFSVVDVNGGQLLNGDPVYLRTWSGRYLRAIGGGGGELDASSFTSSWETTFTVLKLNGTGPIGFGDQINIRTWNNFYVVADYTYPNNKVRADRTEPREWERFTVAHGRPTGFGLVTGNYGMHQGPQPYSGDTDRFMCDFNQLGARWIRIEVGWNGDPEWVAAKMVARAHARGIKVIVVVPNDSGHYPYADCDQPYSPSPTGPCAQRDRWLEAYINKLRRLGRDVFKIDSPYGDARADAFEIDNEPNAGAGVQSGYHIPGAAFAWLLRKSWEWKILEGRPELIISGGTLNAYPTEIGWWNPFRYSQAFSRYPGQRPFDYMGVHPYHPHKIDQNCLNGTNSNCYAPWVNDTKNLLVGLVRDVINPATGTNDTRLFVTEYGWQLPTTPLAAPTYGRCRIPNDQMCAGNPAYCPKNCVNDTAQMVSGMQAGIDAINQSNVVVATLWYQYRDDPPANGENYGRLGLRFYWNGSSYPVKEDVWQKFRQLAGGTGNPEACGGSCGGGFTGWKGWGALSPGIGHEIGRQEGPDWSANVPQDWPGFLTFGPYDSGFGGGRHTAWFYLMVDNNTAGNDVVASLDVVTAYGGNTLARREIRRHEFSAAYQYQWFPVNFYDPCFGLVEARVFWHDKAYMKFGFLYLNR